MPRFRPFRVFLLLLLSAWTTLLWAQSDPASEAQETQSRQEQSVQEKERAVAARAINLLSFVAVDYPDAVVDNATRDVPLYRQLQGNVRVAAELLQQLPDKPGRGQLASLLQELEAAIEQTREPELVRRRANTAADRLAALYQVPRSPAEKLPPAEEAVELYRERCSNCHGIAGRAPPPVRNLDDPARMGNFSLYDFYNVLEPTREDAHGQDVDGDLSSRERWALAVLVASFSAPEMAPSAKLAEKYPALVGLPGVAIVRPSEIPEKASSALRWWRAHPRQTRHLQHPLARAAGLLYLAQNAYRGGDNASAYHQLMLALREGYTPARTELAERNPTLVSRLDQQWQELRQSILDRAPANEVIEKFQRLQGNVVRGREQLQPTSGAGIYGWAALLFLAALGVGLLLWYGLRRPRHR